MFNPKISTKNIMTSNELKELVKSHFNLVEATFGEVKDINGAFTLKFEGDVLEVGKKVTVVTAEGQEMDAPDGYHELENGMMIKTEGSVVTEITGKETEVKEEEMAVVEETTVEGEVPEKMEDAVVEAPEAKIEDIVEAIVESVKEEMAKMKEKMAALEAKVAKMEEMPAAEPTMTSTGTKVEASSKFSKFNIDEAKNADRIKMAIKSIKSKK